MSPVHLGASGGEEVEEESTVEEEVKARLETEDGEPTLEAEVISDFLESVDYSDLYAVEGVKDVIEYREGHVIADEDGDYEEVEEAAEGTKLAFFECLSGEVVADIIDMDDMVAMFEYHVANDMPQDTLEDKARFAVACSLLGLEEDEDGDVSEKFKRGTFKKMSNAGGVSREMVNRMLGAMLNKQAIKRAPGGAGTGWDDGDYAQNAGGYGPGTAAGITAWKKYKAQKAVELEKDSKKTKGGLKKLATASGTKKKSAEDVKKEKAAKKKSKSAPKSKSKPAPKSKKKAAPKKGAKAFAKKGNKKKKKGIAASDSVTPASNISEGASLAGKLVGHVGGRAESVSPEKLED